MVLDDFLSPDFNVAKYKATELTEYVFYYTVFSLQKRVVWRDLKEFPQYQSLVNAPQQRQVQSHIISSLGMSPRK